MRRLSLIATAAVLALPAGDAAAQGPVREFEGTVVSVARDTRTFRLRDTERGTVRIRVTRRTRYERVGGLTGLRAGQRNIEVQARRSNGRWVAIEVERSGGGGEHGGRGGSDDD